MTAVMMRPMTVTVLLIAPCSAWSGLPTAKRPPAMVAAVCRHRSPVTIDKNFAVNSGVSCGSDQLQKMASSANKRKGSKKGGGTRRSSDARFEVGAHSSTNYTPVAGAVARTTPLPAATAVPAASIGSADQLQNYTSLKGEAKVDQLQRHRPPAVFTSPFQLLVSALRTLRRRMLDPWNTRLLARAVWSAAGSRGAGMDSSIDHSIVRCTNDFELVTRAGKELEYVLDTYFKAPPGKGVPLPVKMRMAKTANGEPLNPALQKRMKHLLKTRNAIVHKRHINTIRDRRAFLRELDEVLHELAMEMESRNTTPARSARQLKRFVIAITDLRAPQPWNRARVPERAHGRGREGSTDEDVYRA
jgi:hypothetical protein